MVSHDRRRGVRRLASFLALLTTGAALSLVSACDKVPLLAPAGSVITIFATAPTVASNGSIEIVATVIEKGTASTGTGTGTTTTPAAGTPVHNGTLVSFVTNIGRIEPREAQTQNGEVHVRFYADGASGTAKITAYSGGASTTLTPDLLVGAAGAGRLVLSTGATTATGTEVLARVESTTGSPITNAPVSFSTSAGTITPATAFTDENGVARAVLTSAATATVKASSGSQTAELTVNRAGLTVTASPNVASVGQVVSFAVGTANGQAATNVRLNFGDGTVRNLGTVSGTRTETYAYSSTGNFQVSVTADNSENAGTSVSVGSPDITVAASPNPTLLGNPTTFTATIPSGIQVQGYRFTYDDGTIRTTTSRIDTHVFSSRGTHTGRVDVLGVGGGVIGSATASVVVQ